VSREIIGCGANAAYPGLEFIIDNTVWIQHTLTRFATNRRIFNRRTAFDFLKWRVESANGKDDSGCTDFGVGPVVPGEPYAILHFSLVEVHCCLSELD